MSAPANAPMSAPTNGPTSAAPVMPVLELRGVTKVYGEGAAADQQDQAQPAAGALPRFRRRVGVRR